MEKREFNAARLFKFIKWAVNIVAIISIFILVLRTLNQTTYEKERKSWFDNCVSIAKENKNYDGIGRCIIYQGKDTYDEETTKFFLLGIVMPISFYLGIALLKYILPIKNKRAV